MGVRRAAPAARQRHQELNTYDWRVALPASYAGNNTIHNQKHKTACVGALLVGARTHGNRERVAQDPPLQGCAMFCHGIV